MIIDREILDNVGLYMTNISIVKTLKKLEANKQPQEN